MRHTDFSKMGWSITSNGALPLDCTLLFRQWPCCFSLFERTTNIPTRLKAWDRHALGTAMAHTDCGSERGWGRWEGPNSGHLTRSVMLCHPSVIQKYEECTRNPWLHHPAHTYSHHRMTSIMGSHYVLAT